MTPIEAMALIVVVISLIKLIVILINQNAWLSVGKSLYKNPVGTTLVSLLLGYFVLKKLLVELSIVQIFAVFLFFMFLMMISFSAFSKETLEFAERIYREKHILRKSWLSVIIWIALLVWVLASIF
jgi:hypothetical protein